MSQEYIVAFQTGSGEGGEGTDGEIKLTLAGARKISEPFGPDAFKGDHFEAGYRTYDDTFYLNTGIYLGELQYLYLQFSDKNTDDNPAWFLKYIEVSTKLGEETKKWTFPVDSWIGTGKDPYKSEYQLNNIVIDKDGIRNTGVSEAQFKAIANHEDGALALKAAGDKNREGF